jgi:hypothetical protein
MTVIDATAAFAKRSHIIEKEERERLKMPSDCTDYAACPSCPRSQQHQSAIVLPALELRAARPDPPHQRSARHQFTASHAMNAHSTCRRPDRASASSSVHVLAVNAVVENLSRTAKMNDVDPQAWLADMLARINDHNIQNLDQLLPWNWKAALAKLAA